MTTDIIRHKISRNPVLYVSLIVFIGVSLPLQGWSSGHGERETIIAESRSDSDPRGDQNLRNVSEPAEIKMTFKLDQRLTRSMYMGDRWVSPPTYTKVQDGERLIVESRAQGFDKRGRQVEIVPEWEAADPSMVTIRPEKGIQVALTIHKEGQSHVMVKAAGISRKLSIKARRYKGVLLVDITHPAE